MGFECITPLPHHSSIPVSVNLERTALLEQFKRFELRER
jgi:hypothetical protein